MNITIGTLFRHVYADSNARWAVTRDLGNDIYEAVITDDNMDYAGHSDVFRGADIERAIQVNANLHRSTDESADWWEAQPIDSVVHYHNSFGRYIRGTVQIMEDGRKGIMPTALVGDWGPHDLPRRLPNGSIDPGLHAALVMEDGNCWQPHASNMFENPRFSRGNRPDPTGMDAIDLTVPEPTEQEEADARTFQRYEALRTIIDGDGIPRDAHEAGWRMAEAAACLRIAEAAR